MALLPTARGGGPDGRRPRVLAPRRRVPVGRSTSGDPNVRVELERVVPLEEARIPFLWATGDEFGEFERHLQNSEIVKHAEALTRVGDSVLYYVEWYEAKETFLNGVSEEGSILAAHSGGPVSDPGERTWSFTVRFRDHTTLTRFHQFYQAHEFPVYIDRVHSLEEGPRSEYAFGLTAKQREIVLLAIKKGYYDVPRGATLEEIADELGVSRQAASERLRRGTGMVLRKVMLGLAAADFGRPTEDESNEE